MRLMWRSRMCLGTRMGVITSGEVLVGLTHPVPDTPGRSGLTGVSPGLPISTFVAKV